MMVALGIYVRQWRRAVRRWLLDPRVHATAQMAAWFFAGFFLSGASLGQCPQPFAVALVCSLSGWPGGLVAIGGVCGYFLFWGQAGLSGAVWLCGGLCAALLLGGRDFIQERQLLMPSVSALICGVSGLCLQWVGLAQVPVWIYFLQIGISFGSCLLFSASLRRRDPVLDWLLCGVAVLALAQAIPFSYVGLGYFAAGAVTMAGAFPCAALAGLALDLAQVTQIPMTAALSLAWLLRLIPGIPRKLRPIGPGAVYLLVMSLCGLWDLQPLPGLLIGGFLSLLLPSQPRPTHRRGETGFTQVRLEMASAVLSETERLLSDVQEHPIDEEALVTRAVERACAGCAHRNKCKAKPAELPAAILRKPLGNGEELPSACRKTGRLLQELRRSQEQLRSIRADRDRREEYRAAVAQQYVFLSDYLQSLSDMLSRRNQTVQPFFLPEIAIRGAAAKGTSGDQCLWFAGVECRYYVLLCDGMGTGQEAARDGKTMAELLRKMLAAGFPAEFALRSVNSLCALQGRAGAVTIDLAELQLDTGRVVLYKWGAAPSYLLSKGAAVKVGFAAPPPGLSVTDGRETAQLLSLRKGERLVMLSDGAGGEESLRRAMEELDQTPGELAARILAGRGRGGADDATVAVVELHPLPVEVS